MELMFILLISFVLPFNNVIDGTTVPLPNDQPLPTDHTLTTNNRNGNLSSSTTRTTTTSPDESLGDIGLLQDLKTDSTCGTVDSGIIAKLKRHIRHCLKNGQSVIICYEGAKVMKLSRRFSKGLTNESVKLGKICTEKAREDGADVLYEGIVVRPTDQLIRMEIHAFMEFHLSTAGGYVEDYAPLKGLDIALTLVSNGQMFYSMCGKFLFHHEAFVDHTTQAPQTGPTKSGIHHTTRRTPFCNVEWKDAKAAKIVDLFNVTDHSGLRRLVQTEPSYAIRVGYLWKPNHTLTRRIKTKTTVLIQKTYMKETGKTMPEFIKKVLNDPAQKEMMDYDYLEIPKEMINSVEVLVHTCGKVGFVSAARKRNQTNKMDIQNMFDWSQDFEFLDDCCFQPNEDWELMGKKALDLFDKWPTTKIMKVGYSPANQTLTRKQKLAAKYKYSMSLARRPFYSNKDPKDFNITKPFFDGSFLMPPKLGVEPVRDHHTIVHFLYPREMSVTMSKYYYFQLRQHTVSCDYQEKSDNVLRGLKFFLPRLVGVEVDEEKRRLNQKDFIYSVQVGARSEFIREPKWNAYNPKEWNEE